jgi:hypothetical protein
MLLALSCLEEPDCIGLNNNLVGVIFTSLDENVSDTVSFDSLFINGSKVLYAQTDSGLYYFPITDAVGDTTISLTSMIIPLDYFANETTVLFALDGETDTLKLSYNTQAQFVSEDCGERYVLSKLKAESDIGEITILSDKPGSDTNTKNLQIYFE